MIRIEISTAGSAFDDDAATEVAEILRNLAVEIELKTQDWGKQSLMDSESCKVGFCEIETGTL